MAEPRRARRPHRPVQAAPEPGGDQFDRVDETVTTLASEGLRLPKKPVYEHPDMPDDVTELDGPQLMVLFGQWSAWAGYLAGRLVVAETKEWAREQELTKQKNIALLKRQSGRPRDRDESMTLAKAEAYSRDDIVALADDHQVWYVKASLLRGMAKTAADGAAYLSREITRRQGGDPVQRRAGRQSA